jgi:hypothetical protein
MVFEVVSEGDENRDRDLVEKRELYAKAGFAEYWIVDPELRTVTVLSLDGPAYRVAGEYKEGDQAASILLPGSARWPSCGSGAAPGAIAMPLARSRSAIGPWPGLLIGWTTLAGPPEPAADGSGTGCDPALCIARSSVRRERLDHVNRPHARPGAYAPQARQSRPAPVATRTPPPRPGVGSLWPKQVLPTGSTHAGQRLPTPVGCYQLKFATSQPVWSAILQTGLPLLTEWFHALAVRPRHGSRCHSPWSGR